MPPLLTAIVVSACLGALVGLIRQWSDQASKGDDIDFGGVRTYTFWAMIGCVGAFAAYQTSAALLAVLFAIVGAHQISAKFRVAAAAQLGGTTFASTLLTVLTGSLVYWEEWSAAVVVAAGTMVMLGSKQPLHAWTRAFTRHDVRATLQFVAISGVILPLVPNRDMGPFDAFNPFSTWMMVVLISGLGFGGYIAMRVLGAGAGVIASSLLGGLASSTASTLAFSRRSREEPERSAQYALAVVVACSVMLPRVVVAVAVLNRELAVHLIAPFSLMLLPGAVFALWSGWLRKSEKPQSTLSRLKNPLGLGTAIKFALLYAVIAFLVKAAPQLGLSGQLLPLSFVSGLTDMDAISLSVAQNQTSGHPPLELAVHAIVIAAIANTLLKAGFAVMLGSPGVRVRTAIVLGLTAAVGAGTVWLW